MPLYMAQFAYTVEAWAAFTKNPENRTAALQDLAKKVGAMIVKRALEEPIRQIVENAGLEGSVIVEKVKAEKGVTRGFDAESLEFVDMMQAGIIDPTKVERVALQNAASVAALLLTTEALITDLPEDKPAAGPPMSHGDF